MMTDIEIAQSVTMKPITEIAETAGIESKYLEQYGNYKAKVDLSILAENEKKDGKHYVTVPQAKVSEDNEVFLYRISVLNDKGRTIHKDWAFSDYFFADMPESITFEGFRTLRKSFTVKVWAEDVWGNTSEALEIKI